MEPIDEAIDRARSLLDAARSICVVTGAGISTDSGIPDFRGPEGLWTKDPHAEMLSNYDVWVSNAEIRQRGWQSRIESPTWTATPNPGHRALLQLEERGVLNTLVTQNIDRLHHDVGQDPSLIVEIHGNAHEAVCLSCGDRQPIEQVLDRVRAGELDPQCTNDVAGIACGGILKSATISFGQSLVPDDIARAEMAARTCDLLIAIGTTLSVYPAAGVVPLAHARGVPIIILNGEPTAMDDIATVVLHADIASTLEKLID